MQKKNLDTYTYSGLGAALVMAFAFFIHNVNGIYIEPTFLGFEDRVNDYAKIEKLQNALLSWPWILSGFGHLLTGFASFVLGVVGNHLFIDDHPIASRLCSYAAIAAGCGFLLTGVTSVGGAQTLTLLADNNPDYVQVVFLASTITRVSFNSLAIVAMGWFMLQISWCGLKTAKLPRTFCYFGYLSALSGLLMAIAYIPVYLPLYFFWALWLAIILGYRKPGTW
ncbi:MAG: hypothetical protein DRR42_25945 [Gammaproteobacteria bacterium]|nr:MAG: hypothetical protein DRR42_25945 [Gammaproteobacteria bacterium]